MKPPTALIAVMTKEIRQTLRDKRIVFVLVLAPVIQLVVLGHAVNLDVRAVPTVVADEDRTVASRAFVAGLTAGDTLAVRARVGSGDEARDEVVAGRASVALIVPHGFARDASSSRPTAVQVLTDGSDSNRATLSQSAIEAYATRAGLIAARARPSITIEPRLFYNPTLESALYFVPGVAATLLMLVALVVMAMGLAREKEMGTLEQVLVTPIRPLTLIAGKTIPMGVIGLLDLTLVLIAAMILFDVPVRGPIALVYLGGSLYLLSALGLGLFLSSLAKNQQQAFYLAIFVLMPAILLSGFMTPVANMPEVLQPITLVNPVRHFVEIMRAVMLEGAGLSDILPQLVALAGIGVVIFGAATLAVRRNLS